MRTLGISNPAFQGVTVATQAIVSSYYGLGHLDNYKLIQSISKNIINHKPELLIVGGWSRGYDQVLAEINKSKNFPVIAVYHGTPYHEFFGHGNSLSEIFAAVRAGSIDLVAFVHPQTAEYYRKIKGFSDHVIWLPHQFESKQKVLKGKTFRIGIFGGTKSWYKNSHGAIEVAMDFAKSHKDVEVIWNTAYEKSHEEFLNQLSTFHLLLHPSHIECYSNTIQEAWARGIPVIMSSANSGLYESPLVSDGVIKEVCGLVTKCNIDPVELYNKINTVKENWSFYSDYCHSAHKTLTDRGLRYLQEVFSHVTYHYQKGTVRQKHALYEVPFLSSFSNFLEKLPPLF